MIPAGISYNRAVAIGSRHTVFPAVLDTDDDWLILVDNADEAARICIEQGWTDCRTAGGTNEYGSYRAVRREHVNLVFVEDVDTFLSKHAAALFCARYNITDKEKRCAVFEAIEEGYDLTLWMVT